MKFKSKIKDCRLIVRAKMSSGECLNDKELDFFARKFFRGFLKPQVLKKNLVEYTGPTGISLAKRLEKPISRYDFFFIMEQIVVATQKIENNNLFLHSLVLDKNNVYINEITKEMQFLYVPLLQKKKEIDVVEFMETIIYATIPEETQNTDYISNYVYFIKGLKKYSPDLVEQYIAKEEKIVVNTIKKNNVGQSGFMTDKPKDYYDHYNNVSSKNMDEEATGLLADEEATGLLFEDFEATGLLTEGDEGTALLTDDYAMPTYNKFPYITRVSTGEDIQISKHTFRIGKEQSYVDYFVTNNSAISRSHADIIIRGDKFFVIDLNSKNRTYINEQAIPPQCEMEIFDGNRLKLADEVFIFHL